MDQIAAAQALRFCLVPGRFPWPVRRVEVQAEQERLAGPRIVRMTVDGPITEQVRQIPALRNRRSSSQKSGAPLRLVWR